MELIVTTLLPIAKSIWGAINKEIGILRQKGELTPELETQFEQAKEECFNSPDAQVEPDPQ